MTSGPTKTLLPPLLGTCPLFHAEIIPLSRPLLSELNVEHFPVLQSSLHFPSDLGPSLSLHVGSPVYMLCLYIFP